MRKLANRHCYSHAVDLMLRDEARYIYCEGYAISGGSQHAAAHAWVLDRECGDEVIDNTWARPVECVYLGIPFAPKFVSECLMTGCYGVLDQFGEPECYPVLTRPPADWLHPDATALVRDFTSAEKNPRSIPNLRFF